MSIKKMFDHVNLTPPATSAEPQRPDAKTAPGRLMQFTNELGEAQRKLEQFAGSVPAKKLDPTRVRPSALRNRHEDSFRGENWDKFKSDIASAGGNAQAIKVRPVSEEPEFDYEIVFGHRRHRACLEAGCEVLAIIEPVSDQDLYESMTRENVGRNDLSIWEWGHHYKRGLERVYTTQAQLATRNQMSPAHVTVCLQAANLPDEVVAAFPSPLDISWRWATKLIECQTVNPDRLVSRARELKASGQSLTAQQVFSALVVGDDLSSKARSVEIKRGGKRVAAIEVKGKVVSVRFVKGAMPLKHVSRLKQLLTDFMEKSAGDADV